MNIIIGLTYTVRLQPEGLQTAKAIGELAQNGDIEFVVHAGDLSYANSYQPVSN